MCIGQFFSLVVFSPSNNSLMLSVYFLVSQKVLCCALYAVLFVVKISMTISSTIMSLMVDVSKAL